MEGLLLRRQGVSPGGHHYLIRPSRPDDAEALVSLRDEVAAEGEFIVALPGDTTPTQQMLSLVGMLSEGSLSLTLEVDDRIGGHAMVQRRQARPEAHVGDVGIIVAQAYRRQGFGRLLIDMSIQWCRRVGISKLVLNVLPENTAAIGLYHSMGFTDEGQLRRQVRMPDGAHDVIVMGYFVES